MTAFPSYATGTIAVTAGATSSVGTGTFWAEPDVMPGDILVVETSDASYSVIISDVTDTTHVTHPKWPGPSSSGVAYKIFKKSPQRYDGFTVTTWVDQILSLMRSTAVRLYNFVRAASRPSAVTSFGEGHWIKTVSSTAWEVYFFDGTSDILLGTLNPATHAWSPTGVRESLSAGRAYYVAGSGNDSSNDGLSSGSPFKTIQRAIDAALLLDCRGHDVSIIVADGTYSEGFLVTGQMLNVGNFGIVGNATTPANCKISVSNGNCASIYGAIVSIDGFELSTTGSGDCLLLQYGAIVRYGNLTFGACAGFHIDVGTGSRAFAWVDYQISGGAIGHFHTDGCAHVFTNPITITLSGTPHFAAYFGGASLGGQQSLVNLTYSGAATGRRYVAHKGGVIDVGMSGSETTLPGDLPGIVSSGGRYVTTDPQLGTYEIPFGTTTGEITSDPLFLFNALTKMLSGGRGCTFTSDQAYEPQLIVEGTNNGNSSTYFNFRRRRGTSIVQNGDWIGSLGFFGWNGTGYDPAAQIVGCVNGTPGASGDMPGALLFQVSADGSAAPSTQLTVSSTGVNVAGALTKGSGTFLIDHPLDPYNRDLIHGFVEAPRYDLIYRGEVALIAGTATVDIDAASNMSAGTFAALTQNAKVLSLCNQTGFARVKPSPISGGTFTVECEDAASTDTICWVVMAERADAFIRWNKIGSWVDDNGRLVPEHDKEALGVARHPRAVR
jgi:hypothetical protein